MASGNHLVIYKFVFVPEMTFETFFCAMNDAASIRHSKFDGFVVIPTRGGVPAKPAGGRPVAIFAGNAFGNFELSAALFRPGVERVANQAFWRTFRFRTELQNTRHALADVTCKGLVCAAMLVFQNPGGILGLEDATAHNWLYAAVATRGGTGAGTDVF